MTPLNPESTPLLTFGVPAYSRPALLREALNSIRDQIDLPDYEVLICDDGGLFETRAVVAEFPADRFFFHQNYPALGAVGNWNRCVERARGKWVTILHEDDQLYPWFYRLVAPRLAGDVVAVCTRTVQGETMPALPSPPRNTVTKQYPSAYFLKSAMTPFPGVLFRREVAVKIGVFDAQWGPLADYDFWYRLSLSGRVEIVQQIGAFYRRSAGQWTETAWESMISLTHLMRLRIAREQFPNSPHTGRWLARFFTFRNALSYRKRFTGESWRLNRALSLKRIPFSFIPSGWVWRFLKALT